MNLFKRSSVWKLIVAIFTLSLYAHIAEAKGIATIFTIIVIVLLVVLSVGTLTGILPALIPALYAPGAGFIGYAVGAAATIGLVGVTVGQVQCITGQDSAFFTGCNPQTGSWGGQQAVAGSPVLNNESYTATCNSVSLTYDISNANQYGIYRNGNSVNNGSAQGLSKITYTDSNLNKQTTYGYVLVMTDNQDQQYQYPPINAYTKCLPQCTFGADKSEIIAPAQATLSWNCQDATSCSISPTVGSVNAATGQVTVSPTASTTYILTCSNIDGEASFSTNINVKKPKLEEVIP